ncbi:MAG TPA: hypothetical protein GXX37_14205 [Clostridiaceae bacterium]|nr:hypothetical protein [Clostridiaceae bacterium]
MHEFIPNYKHIIDAANNRIPERIPLYEHIISDVFMERILNKKFAELLNGDENDKKEYFKNYNDFFKKMGYDTVSFEQCIGPAMPGSGSLGKHVPGVIKDMDDFTRYPWDEIPLIYEQKFHKDFEILGEMLPEGMKAIGGPGNGVFELVQDVTGYENLCIMYYEDPELFEGLFQKVGDMMYSIWKSFLEKYSDIYAVCRFGDDLGFKSSTLLSPDTIRKYIIPQYKRLIDLIHSYNKPFLLHSCGNIFEVMDDIINIAGIDAKHSNEDQIAPFKTWVDRYGDRIGLFGGIDTDNLCRKSKEEVKEIVRDVFTYTKNKCGFAIGSGNSIPDYVSEELYLTMIETVRNLRGE